MARLVLDASVLIAYFDPADAHHSRVVAMMQATAGDERIVIASVLAEILGHPYRAGGDAVDEVEAALAALTISLRPVDADVARRAAQLRASNARFRLGDAFVIAAGDVFDADVLTADAAWSRATRRVRVV
ncbi:MAG TPA: PIN domain-containing protein [Candidatus Limnocylindria bacterium]|jgi:PIN domain nuclease of toxin-antitoxin system|nr:PIN domain-containing protein [Candidatus Limnocylindria bacterium]